MILTITKRNCQLPYPSAVIFDFDGVLVDSLELHLEAWNAATYQIFKKELEDRDSLRALSTQSIASRIAKSFGHPSLSTSLKRLKELYLYENASQVPIFPGAQDFILKLRHMNIPFAIGSNSKRLFIEKVLAHYKLNDLPVVGLEDVKRPKPNPEIFKRCAEKLNIPTLLWPRILIFEDSTHGIGAAVKAHMTPCGVATLHSPEILLAAGAKFAIHSFKEITFDCAQA